LDIVLILRKWLKKMMLVGVVGGCSGCKNTTKDWPSMQSPLRGKTAKAPPQGGAFAGLFNETVLSW
jgi:hypothetical protein